jgi:hypothetical protein
MPILGKKDRNSFMKKNQCDKENEDRDRILNHFSIKTEAKSE